MIFDIIRKDCKYLENLIEKFSSSLVVQVDGRLVVGKKKDKALQLEIDKCVAKLVYLEAVLNSGLVPTSYVSLLTKKTYYSTNKELKDAKPLPTATHSFFPAKFSRKIHKTSKSKIELHDSNNKQFLSFLVEHKAKGFLGEYVGKVKQFLGLPKGPYPEGGYAEKVKKAYPIDDEKSPKYALKIFKKGNLGNTEHELRVAMRSAYCNRILGRTGYAFRRNHKQYLLVDWLPGTTLEKNLDKMKAMPIPQRIILVQTLLAEIGLLHKYGILHCDIKPTNIMFNGDSLRIFDFDGARLENELATNISVVSPQFCDHKLNLDLKNSPTFYQELNVKSDIYALGLSLASVYPDIIYPVYEKAKVTVNSGPQTLEFDSVTIKHGPDYDKHEALGELLSKLVQQNPDNRPRSIDEIAKELSEILQNQYGQKFKIQDIPMPTGSAREAFTAIESELIAFNTRAETYTQKFIESNDKPKSKDHDEKKYSLQDSQKLIFDKAVEFINEEKSKPLTEKNQWSLWSLWNLMSLWHDDETDNTTKIDQALEAALRNVEIIAAKAGTEQNKLIKFFLDFKYEDQPSIREALQIQRHATSQPDLATLIEEKLQKFFYQQKEGQRIKNS